MDLDAISGPRESNMPEPAGSNNELVPVERVLAPMINDSIRIDWNVMDRVTISHDARRRYQEWRKKNRKRNENER